LLLQFHSRVSRSLRPPVARPPLGAKRTVRMPKQDSSSGWTTSTRGESAWKEERERVAERNAAVSKIGKATREAYERNRDDMKRNSAARRKGNAR
jgi:hypothetical protein